MGIVDDVTVRSDRTRSRDRLQDTLNELEVLQQT